jgi:hypothetical protein
MFLKDFACLFGIVKKRGVCDSHLKLSKALAALCDKWCKIEIHGGKFRSKGIGEPPGTGEFRCHSSSRQEVGKE